MFGHLLRPLLLYKVGFVPAAEVNDNSRKAKQANSGYYLFATHFFINRKTNNIPSYCEIPRSEADRGYGILDA